jgi:hypothetical protein
VWGVLVDVLGSLGEMMALLVAEGGVLLEVVCQVVDLLVGRRMFGGSGLHLGVEGLVDAVEGQLLRVQKLRLCRGRVESIVVLSVGVWRWWVLGHLGEHPVLHARLGVSEVPVTMVHGRKVEVGHYCRRHDRNEVAAKLCRWMRWKQCARWLGVGAAGAQIIVAEIPRRRYTYINAPLDTDQQ